MHEDTLAQARCIYQTASLLRRRITAHFADTAKSSSGEPLGADLTLPQCNAMMVIRDRGSVTVKELAEMLRVSPPSASAMVDRLVDMDMMIREQNQEDRREVRIRVSDRGESCSTAIESHILATIVDLLEQLGPDLSQQWVDIYGQVREILEKDWRGPEEAGPAKESAS